MKDVVTDDYVLKARTGWLNKKISWSVVISNREKLENFWKKTIKEFTEYEKVKEVIVYYIETQNNAHSHHAKQLSVAKAISFVTENTISDYPGGSGKYYIDAVGPAKPEKIKRIEFFAPETHNNRIEWDCVHKTTHFYGTAEFKRHFLKFLSK